MTANSTRQSSKNMRINQAFLRSNSKSMARNHNTQSNKSILTTSTRKLSHEQSRFVIAKRRALASEFGKMSSSRLLESHRGSEMCCSQGYGIQLLRDASESSHMIKCRNHEDNCNRNPIMKLDEKPIKVYDRQSDNASYYNSN